MYYQIHCSNSCPILELSVKFAFQICHENIIKPLDGAYLSDFGIDIKYKVGKMITRINEKWDPISWGWLSQNTFHTTSTVLVANLIPRRLGKEFYYTSGISSYILI